MVLPFVAMETIRLDDVLHFVFDALYGDAYGVEGSATEIAGFRQYLAQVKARVLNECSGTWSLGNVATKKRYRELCIGRSEKACTNILICSQDSVPSVALAYATN